MQKLLILFTNYLSGSFQQVVEGTLSQWAQATSRVPQGSLLGLLMFMIFVNDPPDALNNEMNTTLYAYESKMFGAVKLFKYG